MHLLIWHPSTNSYAFFCMCAMIMQIIPIKSGNMKSRCEILDNIKVISTTLWASFADDISMIFPPKDKYLLKRATLLRVCWYIEILSYLDRPFSELLVRPLNHVDTGSYPRRLGKVQIQKKYTDGTHRTQPHKRHDILIYKKINK